VNVYSTDIWYQCQKTTQYIAYFFHKTVVTPNKMFIVMYLQVNSTVNLCSIVLVFMVLRLLLLLLASLLGCWSYFCIPTFFCCLLPY